MIITLKCVKRRYILTAEGKRFTFKDGLWAWSFVNDAHEYGVDYTREVYDKIRCLYRLGLLKKGNDSREANVRKMLLGYESSILMDNAVRGILVGDYTLNELLERKGFLKMMRKALFQIDDGPVYIGYTNGDRWNGWATPYFTLEEAQQVQAEFSQGVDFPMLYDVSKDEFRIKYDDDEPYIWKGEDVQTVDGKLHLYGIGAYSHIWDELGSDEKRYLAQTINEFLLDFDTYGYRDEYDDEDEVIDALIAQFADIDVFYKAHRIMNNALLGSDEIFTKLSEVLHI